jgi:hypothetical protein
VFSVQSSVFTFHWWSFIHHFSMFTVDCSLLAFLSICPLTIHNSQFKYHFLWILFNSFHLFDPSSFQSFLELVFPGMKWSSTGCSTKPWASQEWEVMKTTVGYQIVYCFPYSHLAQTDYSCTYSKARKTPNTSDLSFDCQIRLFVSATGQFSFCDKFFYISKKLAVRQ